jgi:signal transduction histidine kinase
MLLKIILFTVVFLNLLLSFFVISQNSKSLNNRFFSLLSFLAALWAFSNFMTGVYSTPFWLESTYALGAQLVAVGLVWVKVITEGRFKLKENLIIWGTALFFSFASFYPKFIAREYISIYIGGVFTGTPGFGLIIYTLFYLLGAFLILFKLYKTSLVTIDTAKKLQLKSIFYGALITLLITAITSFILPSLSIFTFSGLDSIGFILFLFFIAYAITKHHLFNIKVIATELITFSLWIFIFVRTLIAEDLKGMLIEGTLLAITIIVGTLLIKSVIKEVSQREKIELLAGDLQKANERLTELDRQKSEFVSFATHQLRAPLTAMKGYASLILEGDLGKLSNEIRGAITRIYDSSNTLTNIVDDYLNISRIELGSMKYTFDTIDLKELVDNVLGELKPNIEKSHLKFVFEIDREKKFLVHADRDKFKQIIANLIDNAVKYTPVGTVVVSLQKKRVGTVGMDGASLTSDPTNSKILFSVKDQGIGIAPEVLPKLFAKFSRAENGNRQNIHGTGLGLFVAKEIVTAHKGKIWAESPGEGKGSTFFVELDEMI